MSVSRKKLFGGGIEVEIPSVYIDVSNIRQVPDNQECFVERNGLNSVHFDLLERVDQFDDDLDALRFHLEDIVEGTDGDIRIWKNTMLTMSKLQNGPPAYRLLATTFPGGDSHQNGNFRKFTAIFMVLIRLEKERTDIIVCVNIPGIVGAPNMSEQDLMDGPSTAKIRQGSQVLDRIVASFEIKDYGLFVTK